MGLQDMINEFSQSNNQDQDNGIENPFNALKHHPLRLTKSNSSLVVRILPPAKLKGSLFSEARQWWVDVKTSKSTGRRQFILDAKDNPEDPITAYIKYRNEAGIKDQWGREDKATSVYYMNVLPYNFNQQTNALEPLVAQDGSLDTYVLQLTWGQMHDITELLKDPMNNPNNNQTLLAQTGVNPTQEQASWSFASSAIGYALKLTREATQPVKYNAQLLSQYPLAPLPAGWESSLEDISALTTPSYKISPGFVDYVVKRGMGDSAQQPASQPAPQAIPTTQGQSSAPAWGNQFNTAAQGQNAPVAPQEEMPWDNIPQAPAVSQQDTPTSAPVASTAPAQPVAPQAPTTPLAGLGKTMSQNTYVAPQAPQTAPQAPVQPATKQTTPAASAAPEGTNDLDLDDQTKNMLENLGIN